MARAWPQRLRAHPWLLAAQLAALLLLVLVFLAWVVAQQVRPLYGWIAGTPVEQVGRWWGPLVWRQAQAMAVPSSARPTAAPAAQTLTQLLARMAQQRATHLVVLRDGRHLFGTLHQISNEPEQYMLQAYEHGQHVQIPLSAADLQWRQTLVIPPAVLSADDQRFLLANASANHYLLPPYLLATDGDFAAAHALYTELNGLSNEFRQTFAPLLTRASDPGRLIHVRLVTGLPEWQSEVTRRGRYGLLNADGFYDAPQNCLYVLAPAAHPAGKFGQAQPAQTVIRHEAAHQLADALGVAPLATTPWWITEGLGQCCEGSPIGDADLARLRLLAYGRRSHTLRPWGELTALPPHGAEAGNSPREQMACAQAWWLCHYGMTKSVRPRFFKYLAAVTTPDGAPSPEVALADLLSGLDLAPAALWAAFDADLQAFDADLARSNPTQPPLNVPLTWSSMRGGPCIAPDSKAD